MTDCSHPNPIPIVYGYPSSDMQNAAHERRIRLGGCMISDSNPNLFCPDCGKRFLKEPEPRQMEQPERGKRPS